MDLLAKGSVTAEGITRDELRLAARNHALPLEALRYPITPVGLHYLLTHFDMPVIDAATYRLEVGGTVDRQLSLSLADLRSRERRTMPVTFECAGNGRALLEPRPISMPWLTEAVGTAEWGGTPLKPLLDEAGVQANAIEVLFTGHDRGVEGGVAQTYERSLRLTDDAVEQALLVDEMNGAPLPPQHGFPLRLVVPGWYGMTNVKWLARITLLAQPFDGYQNTVSYRMYDNDGVPGEPLHRMLPRSLMLPPGVPEYMTRRRYLPPGPVTLTGRAWSGRGPIELVEVSVDGGATFAPAELDEPLGPAAWRGWASTGTRPRASTSSARGRPTPPATSSRSSRSGTPRATPTTRSSGSRSPSRRAFAQSSPRSCTSWWLRVGDGRAFQ